MKKIYSLSSPGTLLHVINRFQEIQNSRTNLTDENALLQVVCYKLEKDKKVNAHIHLPQKRNTIGTQESWIVIVGSVEAEYYDIDGKLIEKEILHPGDCSITFGGGHSIKSLEEGTIIYEYKNGPYYGPEKDKKIIP
jgi:cupin fold WbuC family metalloprotein